MAYGGKRGVGERVLESKHVIGLFLLMLLFSGIFFALGYVMGRNQYDGQVRAANNASHAVEPIVEPKQDLSPNKNAGASTPETETDPATAGNSDWEFYRNNKPAKSEPRLQAVPAAQPVSAPASNRPRVEQPSATAPAPAKNAKSSMAAPAIPRGGIVLQVAALRNQDDALAIATSLQKRRFAAYVQGPQKDKFYRVQVGPFKEQKAAEVAKKGLESEGFNAFVVKH